MYEDVINKVLEIFKEKQVVRKSELIELIKDDVSKNPGNPKEVINSITKMLVERKMITPLPMSESTFVITKRGIKDFQI